MFRCCWGRLGIRRIGGVRWGARDDEEGEGGVKEGWSIGEGCGWRGVCSEE